MKKVEIILLFVLFLFQNSISNAQNIPIGRYSINFHLKLTATEKENPDSLVVSSGIFFPFFESKRKKISVLELKNKNIIKLDMNAFVVTIANQIVHISPNDTIEFTFRSNKVVLLGANERYQNYFQSRRTEFDSKYISPLKKIQELSVEAYTAYCLDYYQKEQSYIRNYFSGNHSAVFQYLLNTSKFSLVSSLHRGISGKYDTDSILKNTCLSIIDTSTYNNPGIYFDYTYGSALDAYNSVLSRTYNDSLSSSVYLKQIATAKKNLSEPVYNYLLMRFMRRISRWGNSSFNDVAFLINKELKKAKLDLDTRNKMTKCYSDFKMLSKNIQDFGNTRLKTFDNKYLHFSDVIEKKKYIFIDFWASWCGACMPEFPFIKQYQLKYPQIKFIGLSIDENQQSWKTSFTKLGFSKASSFLLVDGVKSKIAVDYNIQAIPRFLLFDSFGKCISASDIRPSDSNFESYLKQLLQIN